MAYGREKNIGKVYGELTVLEFVRTSPGSAVYKCRCSCGNVKEFLIGNMRKGTTTSCGCVRSKLVTERNTIHGEARNRIYVIWFNMKARCENEGNANYDRYGARGIKVCDEWSRSYETFKTWALANGYEDDLTIDRIDNSKGYSPANCRWADAQTQSRNRDYAWHITIDGVTKHAKDWCELNGIKYETAHNRKVRGWSDIDAVTKTVRKRAM